MNSSIPSAPEPAAPPATEPSSPAPDVPQTTDPESEVPSTPRPGATARTYDPLLRTVVGAAALVIVVAGLRAASTILIPLTFALFLATASLPLMRGLMRRRCPKTVALLLTLLLDLALLVALGLALASAVNDVTEQLPRYQPRLIELVNDSVLWLEERGLPASDWVSPASFDPGALVELARSTFVGVASFVTAVMLIALLTGFMLLESLALPEKLRASPRTRADVLRRYSRITREVQRYLLFKTLTSLATGITVGVWVWLLGLAFPVFWGFVAFLFNYVPNVGSVLAAVPASVFALVALGLPRALLIAAGYAVINLWWGNIVEPNLVGRRLRLSPLAIFGSLIFWGWVWGPLGMVLSVPITMVLKIVLENNPDLAWMAVLLEQKRRSAPPA